MSRPSKPTFRRDYDATSNEVHGFDNEVAITTGDGTIEPPACRLVARTFNLRENYGSAETPFAISRLFGFGELLLRFCPGGVYGQRVHGRFHGCQRRV